MNLKIDKNNIEKSFDRIAKDLLNSSILFVNSKEFQFTEIEFYYFLDGDHEDEYTHEHKRNEGEWLFHNQGLDITFQSNNEQDGGILIRGVKVDGEYINGPRKIIQEIFKNFTNVTDQNSLVLKKSANRNTKIFKTFRHLPNKVHYPKYHDKKYRYLVELEKLDIPKLIKQEIKNNSIVIDNDL